MLKISDVVKLNSGGPKMVVELLPNYYNGEVYGCVWLNSNNDYSFRFFSEACLYRVK